MVVVSARSGAVEAGTWVSMVEVGETGGSEVASPEAKGEPTVEAETCPPVGQEPSSGNLLAT